PHQLALDLPHVSLDLLGGSGGLLPLQRHQRVLVLLVGRIDLDATAHQQGAGDERHHDDQVLASEATATPHGPSILRRSALPGPEREQEVQTLAEAARDLVAARATELVALARPVRGATLS